jgi:3alpha(or 20beta)-hydroxysteroid dehydrogenase
MVEDVVDRWGRVDILVNNAGILGQSPNPILDGDIDNLVNVLNVNVVGTYLGMATAGGAMAASGGGSIVNVSSMMGKRGSDRLPAYAASKWAIRGLTQSAAIELAPQSIRVNTVMPGIIDTDMVRNWVGMADEAEILSRNDHRLLIKRLGISEDVTEAVLYLASDRASYVTGTDIASPRSAQPLVTTILFRAGSERHKRRVSIPRPRPDRSSNLRTQPNSN